MATIADSPKGSVETPLNFDPKHGHKESHGPERDPVAVTPLDLRTQKLPTSSSPSHTHAGCSLAVCSHGDAPSSSNQLEASPEVRPSERPIRRGRPVCPYPPLPALGTFYFRTIEKPGRLQYRHYIQYACYPGYTLANGDVHSYCQQNGTWSGTTPACLAVRPCALNNGGCSQLCSAGPHNRVQNRALCRCRPGYMLLDDQRTCRDVNECVEERHQCQQVCVNTLGSFRCSCRTGFQLHTDGHTCKDISECVSSGQPACEWKCVSLSGSHRCICPRGFRQHTDGRQCRDVDECQSSNGGCSHGCRNMRGGYRCVCPESHRISPTNRKLCLAIATQPPETST
ncbi:signal peptide, CUB and EGF-like domain-containing protein 1 [Sardina pilchardus]|uniref:signal peptide, CUB and EGF-like domain-containing protein 1 n=1 Tax=Sardina pilchardus TaxID=27697 RepID=UPI002E0DE55A